MSSKLVPALNRALTAAQYAELADVPPELEWLANITNAKTRRAYKRDVTEFSAFVGLNVPAEIRTVTRAHVIAWRKDLEARGQSPATIRRKLSALSSLFDYLCERNAVLGNPVDGVKRPVSNNNEGSYAGARRCSGTKAARCAAERYPEGCAGPSDPGDAPLSRHPAWRIRFRQVGERLRPIAYFRSRSVGGIYPLHQPNKASSARAVPGPGGPRGH